MPARNGGDLGWVEKGSFVAEFETAVDHLKKNELSKPFQSNFGFHIVELLDRKDASVKPFAEVKAQIEESIRSNKAKRRLSNQVSKLLENPDNKSIEALAQSVEKSINQTGVFDDTKELKDIGSAYQLYQDLKSKTKNQKGQFNLPGDEKTVVYEVSDIKDPFVKPLEEVKEQVRYYAKEEKKGKLARESMTGYEASTKTLNAFDEIAKKINTKSVPVTFKYSDRQAGNLNLSNHFKTEVFKLEKGQIKSVQDNNRNYLVYLIDKKKGELNDKSRQTLASLESMMQNQKSQVVLNSLINKLQKEISIDYNMPLLNAMNVKLDS